LVAEGPYWEEVRYVGVKEASRDQVLKRLARTESALETEVRALPEKTLVLNVLAHPGGDPGVTVCAKVVRELVVGTSQLLEGSDRVERSVAQGRTRLRATGSFN